MEPFQFRIFAFRQAEKRLIARVNEGLPVRNAHSVDISEDISDEETELTLILCIMIDKMRDYETDK